MQFQVYAEHAVSEKFDSLEAAKAWAHQFHISWFEIVDLVKNDVVYTAEDYEQSSYYTAVA